MIFISLDSETKNIKELNYISKHNFTFFSTKEIDISFPTDFYKASSITDEMREIVNTFWKIKKGNIFFEKTFFYLESVEEKFDLSDEEQLKKAFDIIKKTNNKNGFLLTMIFIKLNNGLENSFAGTLRGTVENSKDEVDNILQIFTPRDYDEVLANLDKEVYFKILPKTKALKKMKDYIDREKVKLNK